MALLEVKDLQVYYGVIRALKGISFHVDQGEIVSLIGANGAGRYRVGIQIFFLRHQQTP